MSQPEQLQPAPFGGRRPNDVRIIERLNLRLNEKANEVRRLEDTEVFPSSLADELTSENVSLVAAMDQIRAENVLLRKRCGLPEVGAIELTDQEAEALPAGTSVDEVPDAVEEIDAHVHQEPDEA